MQHRLLILVFLFVARIAGAQTAHRPAEFVYTDCQIVSVDSTSDTIAGISVKCTTTSLLARQNIQTRCHFGRPEDNTYENVWVAATISCVKDSAGILKKALCADILKAVEDAEAYAASNHYAATVVSVRKFYTVDTLAVPGIRTMHSDDGSYVIWYVDGYVYKITLTKDHLIGNLNVLLRHNVRLKWNGQLLNADKPISVIVTVRKLLLEQQD